MLTDNPDDPLILVVEDDEGHAELIRRSFEAAKEEYRLEIAGSLHAALQFIEQQPPELVLSDYRLPDGDGKELVVFSNDAWPVILMTSQGNEQLAVESLKAGAQDYVVKSPEAFSSLPRIVGLALREWSLLQDRIKINEAVSRGKREWEQTFDAVPELISIIDSNHTISRANRAMADRCGLKPEELVGRKCFEVVHGLASPPAFCSHIRMMRDGLEHSEEVEEKHLNGIFHVTVSPLYDSDGRITACVHVARDITERKQAEKELAQKERYQRAVLDNFPFMVWLKDTESRFLAVNQGFCLAVGTHDADGLVGKSDFDVWPCDMAASYRADDRVVMESRQKKIIEEEIFDKGVKKWCEVYKTPVTGENDELLGTVGFARDITDRRKTEEERIILEQQFQQTQKLESLGVLAGGIAHDFNNILTIILGHCFVGRDTVDSVSSNKMHFQQIEGAANRAADLCRQMLAYAGKNSLVQTQVNLWLLLDEMVKMLASVIKKNVTIKLDLKRDLPEITADNSQIQQVVMNLIINAAEAIGDNNGTIRVVLTKTTVQEGQADADFLGNSILAGRYACLEVSDDGCGMDDETQKRVFEPFYTTKFTGRGLGLSAILGIVKAHNGALQLSSRPGVGTTFKCYFPLPVVSEVIETSTEAELTTSAKGRGTILLVDDEEALRRICSALLESMGFSVITAANGCEALDVYRERGSGIDLILMDLVMPEMGGIEAYHELRKVAPTMPVVLTSGYKVGEAIDCLDDDYAEILQKPYRPGHLQDVLMKLLSTAG